MDPDADISKCARGDHQAFGRVVVAHQHKIFGYLGRMGFDCAAAEDIAAGGTVDAANAVEHARLAGAIWPDEGEKLARLDGERHALEHLEPAEAEMDLAQIELSHTTAACDGTA